MTTEPLEPRRLLAGITLITHGYNSDVNGWVATAADDVQARAGGANASSIYTMSVARSGKNLAVTAFAADSGQKSYTATTAGELIIKLDWSTVSTGGYTTSQVAAAVSNYMLTTPRRGRPLAELPIHVIGHSRGASLVTALSQDLGIAGVWVDQQTSLDPHPVDGDNDVFGADFGDHKMASYDNVVFADDYWRTDGNENNFDFDGEPVDGAHQGNLNNTVQKNFIASAHQAVTAYYVGTINTTTLDGGDHPVIPSWYAGTRAAPARTATGFAFSRIAGAARPADGLSTLLGGSGEREEAGQKGSQWANVLNFSTRGTSTIAAGQTLDARFYFADRDSNARVNVVADNDGNPYNGGYTVLNGRNFSSTTLATGRVNVVTAGLDTGDYYLAAYTSDGDGHARWTYSSKRITVQTPDFSTLSNGVLTVTGTAAADVISITSNDGSYDVKLNGVNVVVDQSDVTRIVVQAGTGNDTVNIVAPIAAYVNGGAGFDVITGGDGDDTLSGGPQSDTLNGGAGDDVLNGNGGNNLLSGNGGYDRLYSADGSQDTMLGGSNADRFFGGSGNDSMVGGIGNDKMYGNGGNDTILGSYGVDLINGGAGVDSAEDDPADLRTDIEVLLP